MRTLRANAGFTLIEMLVAISIVVLVVPLAIQGVQTGLGAWERVARQADGSDWRRSAMRVIRNQLGNALPLQGQVSVMDKHVVFKGEPHALEFVSRLPRGIQGGGVYRNRIEMVDWQGERVLRLSYRPFERGSRARRDDAEAADVILLHDLVSMDLRYFGRGQRLNRAAWHYDWKRQLDLPQRVELKIVYRRQGRERQLSLQVPIYASAREEI